MVSGAGILLLALLAGADYVGVIQGLVTNGDTTLTAAAAFGTDQRSTQALKIETCQDIWSVGYVLIGLHLDLIGILAYRSGYVPRVIGVLLVIAGAGYLVDTFGGLLIERYTLTVASGSFVGEAVLMLWLLIKGRSVTLTA